MPREAQRHAVSNGSTTTATSLEEGNLERQIHHSSGELNNVYDRYITVCPQVMQRQDSIDYTNHGSFHLDVPGFRPKSTGTLSGKAPPPFHMQVAIQSNHLHLIIQSNHVRLMCWWCLRPNRSIGYLISPVSSSSRHRLRQSWLMFAVPQVTKTADLNMARIYEAKYQQSRFQCHTCYL